MLKQDNVILQENKFLILSLTKSCQLRNDGVKLCLPVKKGMMSILVKQVQRYFEHQCNQPYLSLLYQTIFCVAYFGLFRIGGLSAVDHGVCAIDVHVGYNKKKFMFILRSSKTHGKNSRPQSVKVSSTVGINLAAAVNLEQRQVP